MTLSINVKRTSGPPGVVNVVGFLKEATTGSPIYGRSIVLWVNGIRHGDIGTLSDGSYGFFSVPVDGRVTFQSVFTGDYEYGEKATPLVIGNYGKVQASISISVSPTSGAPPLDVKITGKLTRDDTGAALGGRPVNLYQNSVLVNDMHTSIQPATIGQYTFTKTLDRGSYSFFTEFPGDDEFLGCVGKDGEALVDEELPEEPIEAGLGLVLLALLVMTQE